MRRFYFAVLISVFSVSCTHPAKAPTPSKVTGSKALLPAPREVASELTQGYTFLEKVRVTGLGVNQRMGYWLETKDSTFKGCVLYLPGLADSIRNHDFYFHALNRAGYRVLAFDYLGQGGSEGDMSKTRIVAGGDPFPRAKEYEIGHQAKFVWDRYSKTSDGVYGRNCSQSPVRVIGWSTGGLAAYKMAAESWVNEVVLIAPGLRPNPCVGEAADPSMPKCLLKNLQVDQIITLRTLTTDTYEGRNNPHLDPIKPTTPFAVKEFATNLLSTAYLQAPGWKIPSTVKGIMFNSGPGDSYVDFAANTKFLKEKAPHWKIVDYPKALHEVHNEVPAISEDLFARTVSFFDQNARPTP